MRLVLDRTSPVLQNIKLVDQLASITADAERQLIEMIGKGLKNQAIADRL